MYPFLDEKKPSIYIKISGHEFEIPYSEYMRPTTIDPSKQDVPKAESVMCVDSIADSSHYLSDTLILGDVFLRTVVTIHDLTNPIVPSLGFAKRNPNYIPGKFYPEGDDEDDDNDNQGTDDGGEKDANDHDGNGVQGPGDHNPTTDDNHDDGQQQDHPNPSPEHDDEKHNSLPSDDQSTLDSQSTTRRKPLSASSPKTTATIIPMRKVSTSWTQPSQQQLFPSIFQSVAMTQTKHAKPMSSLVTKAPSRIQ
eukprot:TRINITY_DN1465_c0_g1_i3.p1 TRINITY_DN1465_c0_g1~~TRINITY_DN1465_c0_g1_i3.p1  ORF type:complete len:251 (+),score=72.05 TRINITY_DN1465_c0_g1_i3:175-927(+)